MMNKNFTDYCISNKDSNCLVRPVISDFNGNRCSTAHAFTMIEILIVVIILAIAAMTAIPMMSSATSMQIRSAANIIASDLEYAKNMAISRGQDYSVVYNASTERYQIEDTSGVIMHPIKKGSLYIVDFSNDSRLDRVDITSVSFDGTNTVSFDYLGSPKNGSGNPLNSGVITIQAGNTSKTIAVEPVTGYISIY